MVTLDESRDTGWTVKHFHARWHAEHGGPRSYPWAKKTLQAAGHVARAPRRGAHRKKRPRNPLPGMMLHQDGSTHAWGPGCQWALIVTLEDASSAIYSAFFVEEEGTMRSLRGRRAVIETRGLCSALDTDRGSHSWHTETVGGRGREGTPDRSWATKTGQVNLLSTEVLRAPEIPQGVNRFSLKRYSISVRNVF